MGRSEGEGVYGKENIRWSAGEEGAGKEEKLPEEAGAEGIGPEEVQDKRRYPS